MINHLALYDLAPFTPGRKIFLCGHCKYSPVFTVKHVFLCKRRCGQENEKTNIYHHCFLKKKKMLINLMFLTNHSLILGSENLTIFFSDETFFPLGRKPLVLKFSKEQNVFL